MAIEKIEDRKQLLINLHSNEVGKKPLDSDNLPLIVNGEIAVNHADGKLFIVDETGSGLTEFANMETVKEMIIVSGGSSSAITALSGVVETLASAVTILNGDEEVEGSVAKQVKEGVVEAENFTKAALGDKFTESGSVMTPTVSEVIDNVEDEIEALSGAVSTELSKKVDTTVTGTNGTARIFNETDGGGAKFEHNDGSEAFVGVNDGGEEGLMAQIYADKLNDAGKWEGAKIDVTNNGIYYTVGDKSFAERAVPENEIATKGELAAIAASGITSGEVQSMIDEKVESLSAASVSGIIKGISQTDGIIAAVSGYLVSTDIKIQKVAEPASGFASEYILVNGEGTQLGDKISITKDQFLKDAKFFASAEDVPEEIDIPAGLVFPALYFIFETLEGDKESWVSVKGLVDTYEAGNGIDITTDYEGTKYIDTKIATPSKEGAIDVVNTGKNFLKVVDTALEVKGVDTDAAILQQPISVTEDVGQLKNGQVLDSGMSVYDILVKMLSKEKWATSVSTANTFTVSLNATPSVSVKNGNTSVAGQTVEVGTPVTLTCNAITAYTKDQTVSAGNFEFGYSDDEKATINTATTYTENLSNNVTFTGDYIMTADVTAGFNDHADVTVTANTITVNDLIVGEGSNKVKVNETGMTANAATAVTPKDFYVATNLKNFSKSETDSDDWVVSIADTWNGTSSIPTTKSSSIITVTGSYRWFVGSSNTKLADMTWTGGDIRGLNLFSGFTGTTAAEVTFPMGAKQEVVAVPSGKTFKAYDGSGAEVTGTYEKLAYTVTVTCGGEHTKAYDIYVVAANAGLVSDDYNKIILN